MISKAKTAEKNKTGSWRQMVKPFFKKDLCIECNMCKLVCPEGCIEGEKGQGDKYNADFDYCKGCGVCANICPKKAIEMVSNK
jgi:2-oxoacid:acceptor oxidoreductase delta subunit (pyruvate/2-ketoisovalerate family)